jgi:hypothetical protein
MRLGGIFASLSAHSGFTNGRKNTPGANPTTAVVTTTYIMFIVVGLSVLAKRKLIQHFIQSCSRAFVELKKI